LTTKDLLDWSVVILPLVLSTWPLLISVESTLKKHPWKWRVSLVLLGIVLATLTHVQQRRTDTQHQAEMDLVQGNFDSTKGQLLLVADTLGDYQNQKCSGLPEMASAIKRIVAALPTRVDTSAPKQGSQGSPSPADHGGSQYEKFSDDQLIAEAKVVAEQMSSYQGKWKYQVDVEVGARYQNEREQSPPPSAERMRELWDEEEKARESVNQQYATNSKVLFARADDLRGVCFDRLKKKGGQLPTDGNITDVFKRLATAGIDGPYSRSSDPDTASKYLLELCKRLGH
jgi:hypothetical protein